MVLLLLHRIRSDKKSQQDGFFDLHLVHEAPLIQIFHFSNLLQTPNDYRMDDVEFFGNFSYSCKMISFDDPLSCSLSTSDSQLLHFSSLRLLFLWQNFLNHHCTVHSLAVPGSNAFVDIASCLYCFMTHFELE